MAAGARRGGCREDEEAEDGDLVRDKMAEERVNRPVMAIVVMLRAGSIHA